MERQFALMRLRCIMNDSLEGVYHMQLMGGIFRTESSKIGNMVRG